MEGKQIADLPHTIIGSFRHQATMQMKNLMQKPDQKEKKKEYIKEEVEMLMENEMNEPSKSPWACGVVMA